MALVVSLGPAGPSNSNRVRRHALELEFKARYYNHDCLADIETVYRLASMLDVTVNQTDTPRDIIHKSEHKYQKQYKRQWKECLSKCRPAEAAAEYAMEMNLSSVAIYRTDDAMGQTLSDSLSDALGGSLCADVTFTSGTIGNTADALGCDAVVVFADAVDSAMIVDDLNAEGYAGQIIGNGAMDSYEFEYALTSSSDNIAVVKLSESSFSSSLSDAFFTAYGMNYGTLPPAFSAEAADGGLIIALSFIYGYNVGLSAQTNSEYVNWFIPAIADEYAGASGYLTVDPDTGDMPSKGHFEVLMIASGMLELEYTWDPLNGLEAVEQ